MSEDLRNWKPLENTEYNGYERRGRHGQTKRAYTIIYFKGEGGALEEHYGGFDIISGQVKIWYTDNGRKTQQFVPRSACEFSKTRSGYTTYYHCVISNGNAKNGEKMSNKDEGYGLNRKPNEGEPVTFRNRKEQVGLIERITGRSSAIYTKRRYEDKLKELWSTFDKTMDGVSDQSSKLKKAYTNVPKLKKNVETNREEWHETLTNLGNLVNKLTEHEKGMWTETQKSRKVKGLKVHQKFKDSDVDEIRFNNMMDYIKQYPELQAKSAITEAAVSVNQKREKVINAQAELDGTIAEYNYLLNTFEDLTDSADSGLKSFEELVKEAEVKVNKSPYNTNRLVHIGQTAYEREATLLDLLEYRGGLENRKIALKRVRDELSEYKRKKFTDIAH